MKTIVVSLSAALGLLLTAASPALAQHEHAGQHSPYAGQEYREIKALSAEDIDDLESGAGMGYARAAELNGLPGPLHVLELRDELQLEREQIDAIERVYETMRSEAISLGQSLIRAEAELEALFRADPAPDQVRELTSRIAGIDGRLRAVHLVAHLQIRPLLSDAQVERYAVLRGYREP